MHAIRSLIVLYILSLLATFYALGIGYQKYTSRVLNGASYKIGSDGWIEDQASFELPQLNSKWNYLVFKFNQWRPDIPDSILNFNICDQDLGDYLVTKGTQIKLYLPANCNSPSVKISVPNPVKINPDDPRELGAQLVEIRVTSKIGVAVLKTSTLLVISSLVCVLSFLVWLAFKPQGLQVISLLIPCCLYFPLVKLDLYQIEMPLWAYCSACLLLLGAVLQQHFKKLNSSMSDTSTLLLFFLLPLLTLAGAALRFHGLSFGLPNNFHPDEVAKVNAISTMLNSGSLNPKYFLHPSLLLYCSYGLANLLDWLNPGIDFRQLVFLSGRAVSAIAGALSIPLVYAIGKRLSSQLTGLLAAALLCFSPLHVTCSRYLKEDALLTFLLLGAFLCLLKALQSRTNNWLYLGAACCGLAASTKYSGLASFLCLAAFPWFAKQAQRVSGLASWLIPECSLIKPAIFAIIIAWLAFFCATPYSLLDFQTFWSDFQYEKAHMIRGHSEAIDAWSQFWSYQIAHSIIPGTGLFPFLLGCLGLGILITRRRREDLYLLFIFLLFFVPAELVKSKPAPQPERYVLVCLPFLLLAASEALTTLNCAKQKLFTIILLFSALYLPTWRTINLARDIIPDTRDQMSNWIELNIPWNSKILIDFQPYSAFLSNKYKVDSILPNRPLQTLNLRELRNSDYDYLILSSLQYDRFFSQPKANRQIKNNIVEIFSTFPSIQSFRAGSGPYGFHNPDISILDLKSIKNEASPTEVIAKWKEAKFIALRKLGL